MKRNVFAPVILALFLLVLTGMAALRAKDAADAYHPSLNLPRAPLTRSEPQLDAPAPRQSRRVVLFLIDGLRLVESHQSETLNQLRARGVDAAARAPYPTISRPNHATAITGTPPILSGIRNNAFHKLVYIDSLMDRAGAADPPLRSAFVGDYAAGMAHLFVDDWDDMHYATWPDGLLRAASLNIADGYDFIFIIAGAVDAAGHAEGGDSDAYREAIQLVDGQLSQLISNLDLERDTIVVTADHGHTDAGGHGGTEQVVVDIPLVMAGKGIRQGAALLDVELVDVAPTVAALLGLPPPGHGVGKTLTLALDLDDETAARLRASDAARIARNQGIHSKAIRDAAPAQMRTRMARLATITVLAVLSFVLFYFARKTGAIYLDWRVLLIGIPAFPLSFYGLLELMGQRLSLSAIPDRGEALAQVFAFGMIATGAYIVAGWIALQGRVVLRDRLAAANALALIGTLLSWIPAAILWAIYDGLEAITIPGSTVLVLVPATYIAVTTYAVGVAVLLGLEIVIFFARAVDPRQRLRRLEQAAARAKQRVEYDSSLGRG